MIKRLSLILLITSICSGQVIFDRDIYDIEDRRFHRSLTDLLLLTGTAEGQILYFDATAGIWTHADVTKLKWNDVTSILLVDTLNLGNALIVSYGGTGATTLTNGGLLLGSGVGAITALGVAANGQIPIGDGTTDPILALITGGTNLTSVAGAGSITLNVDDAFLINDGDDTTTGTITAGDFTTAGTTTTDGLVVGSNAPDTITSAGTAGTITYDANYLYVCIANNSWKRAALSTWGVAGDTMIYEDSNTMVYEDGNTMVYD